MRVIVGDAVVAARGTSARRGRRRRRRAGRATPDGRLRRRRRSARRRTCSAAARLPALPDSDAVLVLGRPARRRPRRDRRAGTARTRAAAPLGGRRRGRAGRRRPRSSRAAASAPAGAPTAAEAAEAAVIPIMHETTLKFGEPREPHDVGPAPPPPPRPRPRRPSSSSSPNAGAPTMFGRYRLVERLGEGGMSELFIAKAAGVEGFTRAFVLKRLRPELARDKEAVAQFIDEARLQAEPRALEHRAGLRLRRRRRRVLHDPGVHRRAAISARLMDRHAERGARGLPSPVAYYAAHETLQALAYAHTRRDAATARRWGSSTATSRRATSSSRSPAR